MKLLKTPGQQCPGVFLWLLIVLAGSAYGEGVLSAQGGERCAAQDDVQWHKLKSVLDGDTLSLSDGRKVRVLAINAPELATKHRPAEALAEQARQAVEAFFNGSDTIGLRLGRDHRDRYGRLLAHVYRANGDSLSAHLLAQGLAWQVVVPPNDSFWHCLQNQEQIARQQGLGLWDDKLMPVKSAQLLSRQDTGFQRVQGVVRSVSRSKGGWWLQLDNLALRLRDNDLDNFKGKKPAEWLDQSLTVRGWVIDRGRSPAVLKGDFSPLMMELRHPAMLK